MTKVSAVKYAKWASLVVKLPPCLCYLGEQKDSRRYSCKGPLSKQAKQINQKYLTWNVKFQCSKLMLVSKEKRGGSS